MGGGARHSGPMARSRGIADRVEQLLGQAVVATAPVAGGDICTATRLRLSDGTRLPRRDLFDVRFQQALLDDLQSDRSALLQGVSDVEAGAYEGGLKSVELVSMFSDVGRSWECSLDLIDVLARSRTEASGSTVCEVRASSRRLG